LHRRRSINIAWGLRHGHFGKAPPPASSYHASLCQLRGHLWRTVRPNRHPQVPSRGPALPTLRQRPLLGHHLAPRTPAPRAHDLVSAHYTTWPRTPRLGSSTDTADAMYGRLLSNQPMKAPAHCKERELQRRHLQEEHDAKPRQRRPPEMGKVFT
jgi:hypothetical protein